MRGLVAGCFHSLAVTSKGTVLGWGSNFDGQLGDGSTADRDRPASTRLAKGTKVRAVSAGCFHSLGRTSQGHVLAWGSNAAGQLGIVTTGGQSDIPRRVQLPAGRSAIGIGSSSDALFSLAVLRKAN